MRQSISRTSSGTTISRSGWLSSAQPDRSYLPYTLPVGFWAISLFGSSVIIAYGIFRLDPVLILGQSFGFVAYIRNLVIGFKEKKSDEK